jgi:hypothetical protein
MPHEINSDAKCDAKHVQSKKIGFFLEPIATSSQGHTIDSLLS